MAFSCWRLRGECATYATRITKCAILVDIANATYPPPPAVVTRPLLPRSINPALWCFGSWHIGCALVSALFFLWHYEQTNRSICPSERKIKLRDWYTDGTENLQKNNPPCLPQDGRRLQAVLVLLYRLLRAEMVVGFDKGCLGYIPKSDSRMRSLIEEIRVLSDPRYLCVCII